ncbi:MAG: metallophosphoesterase [Erythrobacter sp.]
MATRLFHFSDPHFGVENEAALASLAAAVHDEQPDVLICTGDLTQRAKHSEYQAAAEYFGQFDCPIVLCAGNHDMPYYNLWERFTDPFRRFRELYADVGQPFDSEDVVLVPLVTTVRVQPRIPLSDGVVRKPALHATVQHLRGMIADTRIKLVFCHHPLLGPEAEPNKASKPNATIGGDEAFAQIAASGADAVISGHVHIPFDDVRTRAGNRMRMLGTGTLSTRLRGSPPSYQVLTCSREDGISLERRVLDQ